MQAYRDTERRHSTRLRRKYGPPLWCHLAASYPFTNISACCSVGSAVQDYNDCFHYCQTDLDMTPFLICAVSSMNEGHLGVLCNRDRMKVPTERPLPLWRLDSGSLVTGIFLACWIALGIVLVMIARRRRSGQRAVRLP